MRELRLLERIPGRIGRDQVTHPRGVHDDLANALCICLRGLANHLGYDILNPALYDKSPRDEAAAAEAWRQRRVRAYYKSNGTVDIGGWAKVGLLGGRMWDWRR